MRIGECCFAIHRQSPFRAAAMTMVPLVVLGCGRTDLGLPAGTSASGGWDAAQVGDATWDSAESPVAVEDGGHPSQRCVPTEEICNGVDDDCNGEVDEVAPVPCPGGGSRYCVAGRMSQCPKRCEKCIPGAERICQLSYCTFWAVQTCTADGRSFGYCREEHPPPECRKVAEKKQKSRELEQCCVDNGYCCVDLFDLDGDGDRSEHLGQCEEVLCQL